MMLLTWFDCSCQYRLSAGVELTPDFVAIKCTRGRVLFLRPRTLRVIDIELQYHNYQRRPTFENRGILSYPGKEYIL